ncbi:MAG: hypothetical protein JSR58_01765 [Verrucomicrobia bacterium]|nr:hypothetical protein [Verrucomicrobiota bacterium]
MRKLLLSFLIFSLYAGEFDQEMGAATKHWSHVKQTQDLTALNKFRALFEANAPYRFTQEGPLKIPPVVHFIWVGPKQFPAESVDNIRTWMAKNPTWKFKFWTDRERPAPCHGMEVVVFKEYPFKLGKYYEASANWGEKSDILRYEILFYEGGTYVDHDANCLISFDGIHRAYDFYCGLEVPHPPVDGLNVTAGMGVLGARPGHPVIQRVIDLIGGRWEELALKYPGDDGFSRTQIVMERTYLPLTLALRGPLSENGNRDIVFPASYFFAKPDLKPIYSKHFFANAWAGNEKKQQSFEKQITHNLEEIQKKFDRMLILIGLMTAFNLLLLGFSLKYMVRKT